MSSDQIMQEAASELKDTLGIAGKVRGAQEIPADVIEMVRQRCHLTQEQIDDVVEAVRSGVEDMAQYLGVTPAVANTVEAMALEFYRQKHIEYAEGLYAFLLEVDPNRSTAWRGLGACCQVRRLYPMAVLSYQRAIFLQPDDVISTVFLGECLFIDGWREEGIRALERAVALGASTPAHMPWVKRARSILAAQGGAVAANAAASKKNEAKLDMTESVPAAQLAPGRALTADGEVDVEALLAMDQVDFAAHPKIQELAYRLQNRLRINAITIKEVAGFTDEQLYGGYAAACRLIDAGKPLSALEIMGWLLYYDGRNGQYFQVAGLAAQHAKLYCFADYLYAMSLIYDKNNPVTMLYQGEVKIYSFERHAGVEMLQKAVEMLQKDPAHSLLVKRGKALIKQFEKKAPVQPGSAK